MMRKNTIKEALLKGNTIINGWLHIPSTWSAEVIANTGWDSVTVDLQHGLMGLETAIQMLQAISTTHAIPLARANWNDKGTIMKLLDAGAYGMICPVINNKSECEQFVGACRYPPMGYRSLGPTRARVYGGMDYADHANEEILTFAMIESKEAMDNLDDILSVEGLDAVYVGSGDLRLSLTGKTKPDADNIIFDNAIDCILASCEKYNIIPGIWCPSLEAAHKSMAKGFRFIAVQSDSIMLNVSALQMANALKEYIKN